MNKRRTVVATILVLGLLTASCAQNTVRGRQNDGTHGTSAHLILQPNFADRSFSSGGDYMLSTEFIGVTYVWPKGKGSLSRESNEIRFEGKNISCSITGRRLTVNGRQFGEFNEDDRVRVTGDGRIFVNDVEQKPSGEI